MIAAAESLEGRLHTEYERLAARVEDQRAQADRLRGLADQLEERTQRDEHLLEELAAALGVSTQLRIESLSPMLRGQRLQEVAVGILRTKWEPGREIHYKQWFALVQEEGHRVGGKDPLATFLSQVHRAPEVERTGPRTGRYRLAAV
ncbi:MAG TPA: hypothetical protein VF250_00290 [Conexibacter sp.]